MTTMNTDSQQQANENDSQVQVSLVIPVYNEQDALPELLERSLKVCRSLDRTFEIILVNDGSSDRSEEILNQAATENPGEVVAVLLNRNYGQHSAVMAGFAEARGQIIITLDADLQNPPEEVANLVTKCEEGFDVVGTVRQNRQDTFFRKIASRIVNRVAQKATGVKMSDYGCMLRAYKRPIIQAMLQCDERSMFIPILANSFARHTIEFPVSHAHRAAGDSKYSFYKLIKLQFDMLTSMTTFPLRVMSMVGLGVSFLGVAFGVFLILMRIIYGSQWAAQGVFTLFAVLFIFIGAQFVGMGLLGEYIGRIYSDVRARPRYFIDKVVRKDQT